MSKAIEGAAMLGAAVGMGVLAFYNPALLASPMFLKLWSAMVIGGIGLETAAIGQALTANRGMTISTRQSAAYRQIIYGERRVGGVEVYRSTTGSHHDQFNYVIVLAGHVCDSIVGLYLDGRKVYFQGSGVGWTVRNGVGFGGNPDNNSHTGPGGNTYNFGGKVYCEARWGDQAVGDVIGGLTANDPIWSASGGRSPYLGGCTYVYLKVQYDTNLFPGEPEIQFTVRGKNDILDPRTGTRKFTNNWALCVADVLENSLFGLGDLGGVNVAQLIAAANVCDEQVPIGIGGTESRYTCNWAFDSGVAPGDQLSTMMPAAAGRLSYIGGEWYIWPAYWQGPSYVFDKRALTGPVQWNPNRSARDLINRVSGTYIAASYPYNTVGNLYDSNGYYDGTMANTFPFGFQPASYPQYAADVRHGYAADQYLTEDLGIERPFDLSHSCVLSITQAQRVAKITLLRNRAQGSGSLHMNLAAWGMQEADVFQMTFPELGWTNKVLEVVKPTLSLEEGSGEDEPPSLQLSFDVQETQASIYDWSVVEELTVYDVPAAPQTTLTPAPPTNMSLTSGASTAVIQPDGTVLPRIRVEWDTPLDILTKQIQIQYRKSGDAQWISAVPVDVLLNFAFINDIVAGDQYDVRIRSARANGAVSAWLEIDLYTVSITSSSVVTAGNIGSTDLLPNVARNTANNAHIQTGTYTPGPDGAPGVYELEIFGPGGEGTDWTFWQGASTRMFSAGTILNVPASSVLDIKNVTVVVNTLDFGSYSWFTILTQALNDAYVIVGTIQMPTGS